MRTLAGSDALWWEQHRPWQARTLVGPRDRGSRVASFLARWKAASAVLPPEKCIQSLWHWFTSYPERALNSSGSETAACIGKLQFFQRIGVRRFIIRCVDYVLGAVFLTQAQISRTHALFAPASAINAIAVVLRDLVVDSSAPMVTAMTARWMARTIKVS